MTILRFMPVVVFGCITLAAIYLVNWHSYQFERSNWSLYVKFTSRIAIVTLSVCTILVLARRRDFFAIAVSLRIPMPVIYAFLRSSWIIQRIPARAADIIVALKLRGVPVRGPISRLLAVGRAFSAILNTALVELEEATISLTQKGLFEGGHAVSLHKATIRPADAIVLAISVGCILAFWQLHETAF